MGVNLGGGFCGGCWNGPGLSGRRRVTGWMGNRRAGPWSGGCKAADAGAKGRMSGWRLSRQVLSMNGVRGANQRRGLRFPSFRTRVFARAPTITAGIAAVVAIVNRIGRPIHRVHVVAFGIRDRSWCHYKRKVLLNCAQHGHASTTIAMARRIGGSLAASGQLCLDPVWARYCGSRFPVARCGRSW